MRLPIAALLLGASSCWTWGLLIAVYVGDRQLAPAQGRSDGSIPVLDRDPDAYEIYSMLLRTEAPGSVTRWVINQATKRGPLAMCLRPLADQEAIYRPIIQDFERKNQRRFLLERNFDLPEYYLVAYPDRLLPPGLLFEVSAVGFNSDHTRALVYVGHYCQGTCGSGMYHLMAKTAGRWDVDREYHGVPSCLWAA
jgi:hypothetical protein